MYKYKCVIFDCDGVLVDSEPISNGMLVIMANELGLNIDLDYAYAHFKGNSLKNCIFKINELLGKPGPDNFEEEFRRRSFEAFQNEIQPVAGIKDVLDQLDIPFCVASSGPVHKIKLNLELTGLLDYFEGKIFSCYTIGKWKPKPDVFLWAAETMRFSVKECVVIEDSKLGVQAGKSGGFDVYGYAAHDYHNELAQANLTFSSMDELISLLKK